MAKSSSAAAWSSKAWSPKKATKPSAKPAWNGELDSFDPTKIYSGVGGENPEVISVKISPQLKRVMSIVFDSKEHGYETMSDIYRDSLAKGLYMIMTTAQSDEGKSELASFLRFCDSQAQVKKIDNWKATLNARKIEVENITSQSDVSRWVADCLDDAQWMTGKCQQDMYQLIQRYKLPE